MGSAGRAEVDERAPADLAGATAEPVSPPEGARNDGWLRLGQALLIAVPSLIVIAVIGGRSWGPASDYAVMVLRTSDVFGRHTPLYGVVSRNHGWYHPGPSEYWVMAPFQWAIGARGALIGVGLANLAALVGTVMVARRRAGPLFAGIVLVAGLLLVRSLGASFLVDVWNPWAPVLPFLLFVLLAWSIAEDDLVCVPWAVGVGSYIVQAHVGYAPLVLGLSATATVLVLVDHRRRLHDLGRRLRLPLAVSVLVMVVFWTAPVVQQLTGHPGNISALVSYFRHPPSPAVGLHQGIRQWGEEFSVPGPWITGNDAGFLGFVAYRSPVEGLLLVASTLVLGVAAWRRGTPSAGRFAVLVSVTALVGIYAIAHITDTVASYLVRWSWIVAATLWVSLLWSAWCLLDRVWQPNDRRTRLAAGAVTLAAAVLLLTLLPAATRAHVPQEQSSRAVTQLAAQSGRSLDRRQRYLVRWTDGPLNGGVGEGVAVVLSLRGFDVGVDRIAGAGMGQFHVRPASDASSMVIVYDLGNAGPNWKPQSGARRIAHYEPISPAKVRELHQLDATISADVSRHTGLTPAELATPAGALRLQANRAVLEQHGFERAQFTRLAALRALGTPYAVYVVRLPH
jgi:hypothetical protein